MIPILELNQVSVSNKKSHLQNLNLKVEPGYIMGIAGKDGAVKTI